MTENTVIFKEPATPKATNRLIDQTLFGTPIPQAASTANRDLNKAFTPLPTPKIVIQPSYEQYMSGLIKDIEAMKEEVRQKYPSEISRQETSSVRQSIESETNSSLGILKPTELEGLLDKVEEMDILDSVNVLKSEMIKDFNEKLAKALGESCSDGNNKELKKPNISQHDLDDRRISNFKSIISDAKEELENKNKFKMNFEDMRRNSNFRYFDSELDGEDKRKKSPLKTNFDENRSSNFSNIIKDLKDEVKKESCAKVNLEDSIRNSNYRDILSDLENIRSSLSNKRSFSTKSTADLSKLSSLTLGSENFVPGEAVENMLLEDEKAWYQEKSMLNEGKMSLSGVLSGQEEDKLSFSSFLRKGSCPLGSLDDDKRKEPRPTFGRSIVSPVKNKPTFALAPALKGEPKDLDEIPTKESDAFRTVPQHDDEERFSLSAVSSVASASQIAELLSNMSTDSPRTLLKNMLCKASSKKHLTPVPERSINNDSQIMSDFRKSFTELCESFKKQSILKNESSSQTLIPMPTSSKDVSHDNNRTRPSICETEASTRYSSSIDSCFDWTGFKTLTNDKTKHDGHEKDKSHVSQVSAEISEKILPEDDNLVTSTTKEPTDLNHENQDLEETDLEMHVCVATVASMDFDIINKTENEQLCTFKHNLYVKGEISNDAAVVLIANEEVVLDKYSSMTISVTLIPLVAEAITLKLDVVRKDTVTEHVIVDTVTGVVVGEYPNISLSNDSTINFDVLHEGCTTHRFFKLHNFGKSSVPVTLKISKKSIENNAFSFNGRDNIDIMINPGEGIKQKIDCRAGDVEIVTDITAAIEVSLTVFVDFIKLPNLLSIPLKCTVVPCRLLIDQSELILQTGTKSVLPVKNCTQVNMKTSVIPPVGVVVQPSTLLLQPGQKSSISVSFDQKNTRGILRLGSSVSIQVLPNGKMYEIPVISKPLVLSVSDSTPGSTPASSRAPSPMSPTSSVASADGNMQLECTHKTLVWASYPLHSKTQKTCMLRNRSVHKEKLLISSSNSCFKLLKDQKKLEDQIQLSLQPMENTTLTVVMMPTQAGACTSLLSIQRINSSLEKKLIPLFGYGGKAKLIPEGVSRDPDQRMWLYLDDNTLTTSFVLKNVGDAPAFIKITQGIQSTGISISPPECLIQPGTDVKIEISLITTNDRLEYLLSQPGDSAVSVTKLILTLGDESTRHRLNRLHRKLMSSENNMDMDNVWKARLAVLNGLFSDQDMEEVRALRDPLSSLDTLWLEGIHEWNIGVLVERRALETMRLDHSIEYLDLGNTMFDETVLAQPSPPCIDLTNEEGNAVTVRRRGNINSMVEVESGVATNFGVYSDDYNILFPPTTLGGKSICRVQLYNSGNTTALVALEDINGPFTLKTPEFILKGLWYISMPIVFHPNSAGNHEGSMVLRINDEAAITYHLHGKGV
uniref:Abnormal spindle-like microcephaly-associated protein ASH domain-containing protein n=1 Tax=Clastoptera arizonana TaxID=38151 RepID=A0A1B6DKN0_9HEMI